MIQTVSPWPLTAEAKVLSQVSPCEISGEHCVTGRGFSQDYFACFPVNIFPQVLHTHLLVALVRRTNGQSLGTFQKQCPSGNREASDRKVLSFFCV